MWRNWGTKSPVNWNDVTQVWTFELWERWAKLQKITFPHPPVLDSIHAHSFGFVCEGFEMCVSHICLQPDIMEVCGLSRVTRTLCLERHISVVCCWYVWMSFFNAAAQSKLHPHLLCVCGEGRKLREQLQQKKYLPRNVPPPNKP